jgi:hypothetical protein
MADNFECIFTELRDFREEQVKQGQTLVRIETNLANHLTESIPVRKQVGQHEQSIQRLRGAGWVLGILWALLLGIIGFFKSGAAAAK